MGWLIQVQNKIALSLRAIWGTGPQYVLLRRRPVQTKPGLRRWEPPLFWIVVARDSVLAPPGCGEACPQCLTVPGLQAASAAFPEGPAYFASLLWPNPFSPHEAPLTSHNYRVKW